MEPVSMLLMVGCGVGVGLSLAFTGTGGSAFAVPLLIYALNLSPHRAVCVSMAAIGATTAVETIGRIRARAVDLNAGRVLVVTGMIGAPMGAWFGRKLPENWLLVLLGVLLLFVGARMLFGSPGKPDGPEMADNGSHQPTGRGPSVSLAPRSRTLVLCAGCAITGFLAGLLGVGGGFILVPTLVLFAGVGMHRAVATSLAVIALVSLPATVSHWLAGQTIPWAIAAAFAAGCVLGLKIGALVAWHLSGFKLQRIFGVAMLLTAAFILFHTARDWPSSKPLHPTAAVYRVNELSPPVPLCILRASFSTQESSIDLFWQLG